MDNIKVKVTIFYKNKRIAYDTFYGDIRNVTISSNDFILKTFYENELEDNALYVEMYNLTCNVVDRYMVIIEDNHTAFFNYKKGEQ